jgi:quercetin dioxygenase-like cupin family protein
MATTIAADIGCSCVPPEGGERIRIFDEELLVKVTGTETAGAYALVTVSVAPGGGPPMHAHPGNETFSVLSGEFEFTQRNARGVSTFRANPGAVVHAPGGAPHRFENVSPTRSTLLIVVSADSVDFLREMGAAFPPGAQPDMEKVLTIHAQYDIETFHGEEGSRPEPPKEGATSGHGRSPGVSSRRTMRWLRRSRAARRSSGGRPARTLAGRSACRRIMSRRARRPSRA